MIKKIMELTKEQEEKLPSYREKWISLGLSTEKANREKTNSVIDWMYLGGGLDPPKIKIWLRSPHEGVIAAWWFRQAMKVLKNKAWDQVRSQIMHGTGDSVCGKIRGDLLAEIKPRLVQMIGSPVEEKIKTQLSEPIKEQVRDRVWGPVWNHIKENTKPQTSDFIWGQLWPQMYSRKDQTGDRIKGEIVSQMAPQTDAQLQAQAELLLSTDVCCAGFHDGNILAPYDFYSRELGLDIKKLPGLMAAAERCGWFWPFDGAVIITEKPVELCCDSKNRIHNDKDKAIKYSDGWGVPVWYGTRVEEWVIKNPELITLDKIIDEKNPAVRRVMRERFGTEEFYSAMIKADKVIKMNRRKDPVSGLPMTLFRYDEKEGPTYFVHVFNGEAEADGARREFILGCRNFGEDAWESLAGTYPELTKELKDDPRKFEVLKSRISRD